MDERMALEGRRWRLQHMAGEALYIHSYNCVERQPIWEERDTTCISYRLQKGMGQSGQRHRWKSQKHGQM